jgi:hypothetical protein
MKKGMSGLVMGVIILGVLIVLAGGYFLFFNHSEGKVSICAKEGETTGAQGMPEECCAGLTGIAEVGYQGNCSLPSPTGGLLVCSNCGDGICNFETIEDKCNCPADCIGGPECVGEGETFGGYTAEPDYRTCCEGLNMTYQGYSLGDDGKCIMMVDDASMCTKCGDGVCGPGENKCNCPADCS